MHAISMLPPDLHYDMDKTQSFQNVIGGNRNSPWTGCAMIHNWTNSSNEPRFTTSFFTLQPCRKLMLVGSSQLGRMDGLHHVAAVACSFVPCYLWLKYTMYHIYSYFPLIYGISLGTRLIFCLFVSLTFWTTVGESNSEGLFPIACVARFTYRIISLVSTDYAQQDIFRQNSRQTLTPRILSQSPISL